MDKSMHHVEILEGVKGLIRQGGNGTVRNLQKQILIKVESPEGASEQRSNNGIINYINVSEEACFLEGMGSAEMLEEKSMSISGQCTSHSSQGREALDLKSAVFPSLERGHCCQTEIF